MTAVKDDISKRAFSGGSLKKCKEKLPPTQDSLAVGFGAEGREPWFWWLDKKTGLIAVGVGLLRHEARARVYLVAGWSALIYLRQELVQAHLLLIVGRGYILHALLHLEHHLRGGTIKSDERP